MDSFSHKGRNPEDTCTARFSSILSGSSTVTHRRVRLRISASVGSMARPMRAAVCETQNSSRSKCALRFIARPRYRELRLPLPLVLAVLVRDPVLQRARKAPLVAAGQRVFLENGVYLRTGVRIERFAYSRVCEDRGPES